MPSSEYVRQALVDELVLERYGPVHRSPERARAAAADTPDAVAERQRVLSAALDGAHLVAVEVKGAAA